MILLILVLLLASTTANSPYSYQQPKQDAETEVNKQNLKQQAQELTDAMVNGNFARAADLTYPKLISLMGGRAKYIATVERAMKETLADKYQLSSVVAGEPHDIIKVKRDYYAIVPTKIRIQVPEGVLVGVGFMVGVSTDGGQNWTFVDSGPNEMDKTKFAILFGAAAADKLRLPEIKKPVLYRN